MSDFDWKWKIGILQGLGERAFQVLGGKIRRITAIIPNDQGGLWFAKCLIDVLSTDDNPQIDADKLVLVSYDLKDQLHADLDRMWSNSKIIPVNGSRMPK